MSARRLAIVVPYRKREAHLGEFVPHLRRYLTENEPCGRPTCAIHVVEQLGDAPFNRGKLLNCGFTLVEDEADYVVFHDVDYLPIDANYNYVDAPTRLIWHGLVLREHYDTFFGAVTSFQCAQFRDVNGYSNEYWGWGCEDVDLRFRCAAVGFPLFKRDGRFRPLPHPHNGFLAPGVQTPEAIATTQLLKSRLTAFGETWPRDGLSSLRMDVKWTRRSDTAEGAPVFHHGVSI